MTRQVRNGYRKHWKGTWGFALLLALAVGAILIPLASGGGGKTYTLSVAPMSFCAGATNTSTVTITNTARTQSLGSAELFFPSGSISSVSLGGQDITATSLASSASGSPYYSGLWDIIGPLNNLNESYNQSVSLQVTYKDGSHSGNIQAVVKQANMFNDTSASGGANVFDNPPPPWPQLNIATCHYVFTQGPVDAQTGKAQTVKVQLWSGTTSTSKVPASGSLQLTVQNGTPANSIDPAGLISSAQDATNTWVFNSVTGNQSGTGYQLVPGGAQGDASKSFNIYDCLPLSDGTCNTPKVFTDSGGYQVSGTGLTSGFDVYPVSTLPDSARSICEGQGWKEMTYTKPDGTKGTFDGITTSTTTYSSDGSGSMLVTLYFRNDLYVQTPASQTNSIQLCAGAVHTVLTNGVDTNGVDIYPWTGANGIKAKWDQATGLYWGVLQRIPNCNSNKVPVDSYGVKSPALCAWGTVTDPNTGVAYRTATMIVPYDWDFYPKG